MNDYLLQTELTDETKREVALKVEKLALESEIREQERKIKKHFTGFFSSLGLLILYHALINFFWHYSVSFFYTVFGILNLIQVIWLLYGWRKKRQNLTRWTKIVNELGKSDESSRNQI